MNNNLESKVSLTKLLEAITLLTVVGVSTLFTLGHLAAYWYFSSFDVPYFKYTDTHTAFSFALKSFDVLLSVLTLFVIVPVIIGIINAFKKSIETIPPKTKFNKLSYVGKLILQVNILAIIILLSVNFLGDIVTSSDLKKNIVDKKYIPFEVSYNNGSDTLKCVTTIGSLGQYQVFISQSKQATLVQDSSIISVKKMFAPVPISELSDGGRTLKNPYYEKELKVWLTKWKAQCPSEKQDSFEYFDFSTSGRNINPR